MFKQILLSKKYLSPLEKKVDRAFEEWNLHPEVNFPIGYFEVDFAFPEKKVCIEIDGEAYHSTPEQKSRDKFRQKLIEKEGWTFERFDGWFAYKWTDVLVAKIILRYLEDMVKPIDIKRAKLKLANYFRDIDEAIYNQLMKEALA